jgi:hypothetical protein
MHHQSFVLLLFGLAACYVGPGNSSDQGSVSAPTLENKSGARLRHRYAVAEDGAQVALSLFDTKLNTDCAFAEAEDGKQRCLPLAVASPYQLDFLNAVNGGAETLYKDSACSDRVAFSNLCQPATQYIKFSDTCGSKTRIAQAVEFSLPPMLYSKASNGTCGAVSTIYTAFKQLRLYTFGPAVSPDAFVSATVVVQ